MMSYNITELYSGDIDTYVITLSRLARAPAALESTLEKYVSLFSIANKRKHIS